MTSDEIKSALRQAPSKPALPPSDFLSTGSTLLNLALSGHPERGIAKGTYSLCVGDSGSGKTFLLLGMLAEACRNKNFDKYRLIFDNAENGALMDMSRFFGKQLAERIEPPAGTKADPTHSRTVQNFYDGIDTILKKGPCIYILDSADVLSSDAEIKQVAKRRSAKRTGEAATGSYGDGKAKAHSEGLRQLTAKLEDTGSILVIVSQTRDNIGDMFNPKTRSGGHALTFYACTEFWMSTKRTLKRKINEKDRQIGMVAGIRVKKNRLSGKTWDVSIPFYHSYGMDDIGSCIDFLIDEGHWSTDKSGKTLTADEFDYVGTKQAFVRKVEDEGLLKDLVDTVQSIWAGIEQKLAVSRKPRYE